MEYKLTFEDGSSGYLSHHGVKGMKWGVWNAETRARYGQTIKTAGKEALKTAALSAGVTFARTLNPAAAGVSAAVSGVSSFSLNVIASSKNISDGKRALASTGVLVGGIAAGHAARNYISPGLTGVIGSNFQMNQSNHIEETPTTVTIRPDSISGILSNAEKPHVSPRPHNNDTHHEGQYLVEQLMNADIPESLKRK